MHSEGFAFCKRYLTTFGQMEYENHQEKNKGVQV
jgi:hypothetical protein